MSQLAPAPSRLGATKPPRTTVANTAIAPVPGSGTTYTGPTVPLSVARRNHNHGTGLNSAPRRVGWVAVKEGSFVQTWKQRFMILRNEWADFFKSEDGKVLYTLFLSDITAIGRAELAVPTIEIKRSVDGPSSSPGERDGAAKVLFIKVKSDEELYTWIDFIHIACPGLGGVSNPTNFFHGVHVGFDATTREFVGLPREWVQLLGASAITKEDYARNPQAVIEAVDFYADLRKRADNPSEYLALEPSPISRIEESADAADNASTQNSNFAEQSTPGTEFNRNEPDKAQVHHNLPTQYPPRPPVQASHIPALPGLQTRAPKVAPVQPALNYYPQTTSITETKTPGINDEGSKSTITSIPVPSRRRRAVRHITTSEAEFIAKLQSIVSQGDPTTSYLKQKKIGQGASGSVYVAKIAPTASGVAAQIVIKYGRNTRVAIKEMNLARQHRKELLIDEIMIMKQSRHANIINFLDAFLLNDSRQLWVIMDYMEGGALNDIIDNNPTILERHIATICREVTYKPKQKHISLYADSTADMPRLEPSALTEHHSSRHQERQCAPGSKRQCQDQ